MVINLKRMTAIFMAVFFVSAAHGQEKGKDVASVSFNVGSHSAKLGDSQSQGIYLDFAATLQGMILSDIVSGVDFTTGYTSVHWQDDRSISSVSLDIRPIITFGVIPHIGFNVTEDTMAFASFGVQITALNFDGQVGAASYDDIDYISSFVVGGGILIRDFKFGEDDSDQKYIARLDYRFMSKADSEFNIRGIRIPYEYGDSHLFTIGIGWRVE